MNFIDTWITFEQSVLRIANAAKCTWKAGMCILLSKPYLHGAGASTTRTSYVCTADFAFILDCDKRIHIAVQ